MLVDYQFNLHTGTWNILYDADQSKNNLRILLQWSPFTTEAELLKHVRHLTQLISFLFTLFQTFPLCTRVI